MGLSVYSLKILLEYLVWIVGVESIDSGEYFCLVNNSTVPRLRYSLAVQGTYTGGPTMYETSTTT